jgi:hypothetical protein
MPYHRPANVLSVGPSVLLDNTDFDERTRLHSVGPCFGQNVPMQESVAETIRYFDENKISKKLTSSFVFDGSVTQN